MAQERKGEYNASLTSVAENKFRQGLLPAGRYKGFDTMADYGGTGVNINILHTGKGFTRNTFTNPPVAESSLYSYIVTPQGVAIETDVAATNISIDATTGGNGYRRVDAVVFEHEYTQVQGGAVGNVIIIKGTESDGTGLYTEYPAKPGLANNSKQTLLGYIFIKESASFSYADLKYVPVASPDIANEEVTKPTKNNYQESFWGKKDVTITTTVGLTTVLNVSDLAPIVFFTSGNLNDLGYIYLDDVDGKSKDEYPDNLEIKCIVDKNTTVKVNTNLGVGLATPFNIKTRIRTLGNNTGFSGTNGMPPTVTYVKNGEFTLLFNKNANRFEVVSINNNVGNKVADYESGWFMSSNLLCSTTGIGGTTGGRFFYKRYFANASDQYSGAALNQVADTMSFVMNVTLSAINSGFNTITFIATGLGQVIPNLNSRNIVMGYVEYTGAMSNSQAVTLYQNSSGELIVRTLTGTTFPAATSEVKFYFNATLPMNQI